MLAMTIRDGALTPTEVPLPTPGPGQVLIKVAAVGVNRADLLQVQGHYPSPPGAPAWPGLEVCGKVAALGPHTAGAKAHEEVALGLHSAGVKVHDEVVALVAAGAYAEYVVADAGHTLPVPPGLSLATAAALPQASATTWWNLSRAQAHPGHRLLVRGGSGGLGSLAVQIAAAAGLRVVATAGGPQRCARLAALGITALDHNEPLLPQLQVHEPAGVDLIFDVTGAGGLAENLTLLAQGGCLIVLGLQRGRIAQLDLSALLAREARITGSLLRPQPAAVKAHIMAQVRQHIWPHVAAGLIQPVIAGQLPLTSANEALAQLAAGTAFGKLILTVN